MQIKPSGKIKFMSAYRFFRKEMVPVIKKCEPTLDSNGRHQVVHNLWTQLQDHHKLAYVLMSRADKEKALYIIRLHQIKDELRQKYPHEFSLLNQHQEDKMQEQTFELHNKSCTAPNFSQ
mgnify:CR=1 FL=1